MRTNRWKIFPFLCTLILSSCTSCNEPIDTTVLPEETQSGKNTFGCYANGVLYVGGFSNFMGPTALSAIYNINTKGLLIISYGKLENMYQQIISIEIQSPVVDSTMMIYEGYYESQDVNQFAYYSVNNGGEIFITKLDTISKIVSGKFNFIGKARDSESQFFGKDSIIISEGRFDLKMEIIN